MANPLHVDQVAALFDVTPRAIRNWQQQTETDPLPVLNHGKGSRQTEYDPRAVFLWGLRRFGNADEIDVDRERALNLRADTRLKELREQQLRGELAPISLLEGALAALGARISAVLETIAGRLKRVRPDLTANDLEIIKREIIKCQNACADIRIDSDIASSESDSIGAGELSEASAAPFE